MLNQIATYLQVSTNSIVRCDEWANVYFVIVAGCRPTFISKKVVKVNKPVKKLQTSTVINSITQDKVVRALGCALLIGGYQIVPADGESIEDAAEAFAREALDWAIVNRPNSVFNYESALQSAKVGVAAIAE